METLSEHNKRVSSAGVSCDKCGAAMEYDLGAERREQESPWRTQSHRGRPVVCPKCGYTGRLQNGWV